MLGGLIGGVGGGLGYELAFPPVDDGSFSDEFGRAIGGGFVILVVVVAGMMLGCWAGLVAGEHHRAVATAVLVPLVAILGELALNIVLNGLGLNEASDQTLLVAPVLSPLMARWVACRGSPA